MTALTEVAAQGGGAPRVGAFDGGGVNHGGVAIGAGVVRAECFAALGNLARVSDAGCGLGVLDRGIAVGAAYGVA